eukprot:gene12512-biopygen10770
MPFSRRSSLLELIQGWQGLQIRWRTDLLPWRPLAARPLWRLLWRPRLAAMAAEGGPQRPLPACGGQAPPALAAALAASAGGHGGLWQPVAASWRPVAARGLLADGPTNRTCTGNPEFYSRPIPSSGKVFQGDSGPAGWIFGSEIHIVRSILAPSYQNPSFRK